MSSTPSFVPMPPLFDGKSEPSCRASIIVPARNEEASLPHTLNSLHRQVDASGQLLDKASFEILLLLNNCTDDSLGVARQWQLYHPEVFLHVIERTLSGKAAHVGTARRMLMDTAWHRMSENTSHVCGILSTDSDTTVAPDWIFRNLQAFEKGADAIGGAIRLKPGELDQLPEGARHGYLLDREYQRLVAEYEDLLDPQDGDFWPRHLEHFGASLACTPGVYALVGGMPPVSPLEDVAFVDCLRKHDARLRHDPDVVVYTSARLDGRARIGLSFQLREWQRMSEQNEQHLVPGQSYLKHRFQTLSRLRSIYRSKQAEGLTGFPPQVQSRIVSACESCTSTARFLSEIDCDEIIRSSFTGQELKPISSTNQDLKASIATVKSQACL